MATKKKALKKKAAKAPAKAKKAAPRKAAASGEATAAQRIDEKIASLNDWRGRLLADVRGLVHEVQPDVVEEWKWMGTPVWSHNGMIFNANPFKDKVKITFHHGAQLKDANKLFNNGLDGNKWRAIDLYEKDTLDRSGFKALLNEAIAYNTAHDVPKSKGSRASLLQTKRKK